MNIDDRINSFHQLGLKLKSLDEDQLEELQWRAQNGNPWFTNENITSALTGITKFLEKETLNNWVENYELPNTLKTVGTVMAGNIPLVGFHDLLCTLISGHKLMIKLSSQDNILMSYIIDSLIEINPEYENRIIKVDQLKDMDAIIATGSDNSARYFEYYFSKYPHIIRKNRTSCAILNENETETDLENLGKDIFQYFGLGCRNVSKLFVPKGYDFTKFFQSIESFSEVRNHHKYNNNYEYNKSIYLINKEEHLDNGFLLIRKSDSLVSPISVLFFEEYYSKDELKNLLDQNNEKIQCIVSKEGWWPSSFNFGQAQSPGVADYADHVDTLEFLCNL